MSTDWMWCYESPKDAAVEIDRLEAEIERLRAVLEPFALVAEFFPATMRDMEQVSGGDADGDRGITVGDLRRAAAAYQQKEN